MVSLDGERMVLQGRRATPPIVLIGLRAKRRNSCPFFSGAVVIQAIFVRA